MKSEILQQIKNRIEEKMPQVVFADLYRDQDLYGDDHYPFPLPAVFVEFTGIDWSNQARGHQMGDCVVRIHLLVHDVRDTFSGSESEQQGMDELDMVYELWNCLEGMSGEGFGALNRKQEQYNNGHWVQQYQFVVHESMAEEKAVAANVLPRITMDQSKNQ